MFAVFRKIILASVLVLSVFTTGAWQSNPVALAQSQDPGIPETPLYPGLTWSSLGASTQSIRTSVNGDSVSLSGERYAAQEQFMGVLPEDVLNFYSTEKMAASGWASYDVVEGPEGFQFVFSHETGVYLSLNFLICPVDITSYCVSVWKSEPGATLPAPTPGTEAVGPQLSNFNKTSPSDDSSNVNPTNAVLSWGAMTGADKYAYCVKAGSTSCADNDDNWTSSSSRSVTLTNLAANTTYTWQVRATDCSTCVPKPWAYANNDTAWQFKTSTPNQVTILGNAGAPSTVLSYFDGSAKSVTSDSTGAYSIKVSYNWTGTITPAKAGFFFTPASASFAGLTASQTIQNFVATAIYVISGNVGVAGATLSFTNGTPVTSDALGNYSLAVPAGWSGTVTPSKASYSFNPASKTYTNVQAPQTAQNYIATFITYTISGDAGTPGATLTYKDMNNNPQFVTADGSGSYSITVPSGWSGTVTPHKILYSFTPGNRSYNNVQANATGQGYTAFNCPTCADQETTGVFRPSNGLLYLKNLNITGFADVAINYGLAGDYPVVGDWDGDGDATIGIYRSGTFYLRNSNTVGFADIVFAFGGLGDQPIAGDWNGDGVDTIGVYRPSTATFYLRNSNAPGIPDITFVLGNPGDVGIAGDWNGDGTDTTGVFRPGNGVIFLKNSNDTGIADLSLNYGLAGDKPVTGDWDGDGDDTIGVYRGNVFYLKNDNAVGFADIIFSLGVVGDTPIAGDWDNLP